MIARARFFLALVDDECHELIPDTHVRFRTDFEHDVLLPQAAKDDGIPFVPSWDGSSILPNVTAIRLRAGELMIRDGKNIHRGHAQKTGERLTHPSDAVTTAGGVAPAPAPAAS